MQHPRSRTIMAVVVATFLLSASPAYSQEPTRSEPKSQEYVLAENVGQKVEEALKLADSTGLSGLTVQEAELTLETGSTVEAGFELNFLIFTISHKNKKQNTQTTALKFSRGSRPQSGNLLKFSDLKEPLAEAIATAAFVASQVHTLPLKGATIELVFAVDKDSSGKISFTVAGVKPSASVDFDKTSKNSLKLTFQ